MNGLEKIIDRIISEAEAAAAAKIKTAETEAESIRKTAEADAASVMADAAAASKSECAAIKTRAASSVESMKRSIMLTMKASAVEDAYASALKALLELPEDSYRDLLCDLLYDAVCERVRAWEEIGELYGAEEQQNESVDSYIVMFSAADRDKYGKAVIKSIRRRAEAENASDNIKNAVNSLKLSAKAAKIEGGLILISGDIETNCSIALLIERLRDSLDTEVYDVLFGADKTAAEAGK